MEKRITIEKFAQMMGLEPIWLKRLSFTSILVSANMLQTMFTNTLDGLTSKQWLLLTITSSVEEPQTLSSIGATMGCSRQNVKQITDILKKKGFVEYCKLEGDKNTIRVKPTMKWVEYCEKNGKTNEAILDQIFDNFSKEDLESFFKNYCKIVENIEKVNQNLGQGV